MDQSRVIGASIPAELLRAVHARAELEDRSTAGFVREALRKHVDTRRVERRWGQ